MKLATIAAMSTAAVVMIGGLACIIADTQSNIEFLANGPVPPVHEWDSLMRGAVALAIATAVALPGAQYCWRRRQPLFAGGLVFLFVVGAAFSLSATIDRVATHKDGKIHVNNSANGEIAAIGDHIAKLQATILAAKAGMARECSGREPAALDPKRWPQCRRHWSTEQAASEQLAAATLKRASLGALRTPDSGAATIAALLPGVRPEQISRLQPLLQPIGLFLGGNLLLALGVALWAAAMPTPAPRYSEPEPAAIDITPHVIVETLRKIGRPLNNGELAQLTNQSQPTTHRRVAELIKAGIVVKHRNGREVAIALKRKA